MNRKSFIRNLIGSVAALTIAPYIKPIAIMPPVPEYIVIGGIWMTKEYYELLRRWNKERELTFWYGASNQAITNAI